VARLPRRPPKRLARGGGQGSGPSEKRTSGAAPSRFRASRRRQNLTPALRLSLKAPPPRFVRRPYLGAVGCGQHLAPDCDAVLVGLEASKQRNHMTLVVMEL
jgi:hypothetical protein